MAQTPWLNLRPSHANAAPKVFAKAGILRRIIGYCIDYALLSPVIAITTILVGQRSVGAVSNRPGSYIPIAVISATIMMIYSGYTLSGPHMATLGKRAMGIQVRNVSGGRVTFAQGAIHKLGVILSFGVMVIPALLVILVRRDGRGIHELIAGTHTIRSRKEPEATARPSAVAIAPDSLAPSPTKKPADIDPPAGKPNPEARPKTPDAPATSAVQRRPR